MAFGSNPTTTGQGSLGANQLPISTVAVPNTANGNLTALQGGPAASADVNGNVLAPVSIYVYDGNDVTQGTSTDAANFNSVIGQLKQIKTNTGSVTIGTALPAGTNVIGHVIVDSAGNVSITSLPALPAGTNVIGHVIVDSASSVSVTTLPGVGTDGSAIPAMSMLMGASDGTLLQQLLVESSSNHNLRIGIYSGTNEAIVTGANALKVDNSAVTQPVSGVFWQTTQPVSAASLPLPTGASTAAKQPALGTAGTASTDVLSVQGIASMTPLKTDGSGVTQPVSGTVTANIGTAGTLALETGGNLATTVTRLSSILSQLQGILQIEQPDLSATGTISAAQPVIGTPVTNATVQLALAQGQSTWRAMLSNGGGGFTSGTTIVVDKSPDGGTTWFASSFKVAGASPNTPVSSVVGPGPLELVGNCAGATHVKIRCSVLNSTETIAVRIDASVGVSEVGIIAPLPAGSNNIGSVNVANGNANGQATMANSAPVVIASDQSKLPTKAASGDFATNSIVDLTTIITNTGRIPAQGQSTMSASTPVALASDQTPLVSSTATRTNVAAAITDTSLLTSNTNRKGAIFYNDSTAILYLAYGAGAASTTSYSVQIPANGYFEIPPPAIYNGAIRGIWSAANGTVRITELS